MRKIRVLSAIFSALILLSAVMPAAVFAQPEQSLQSGSISLLAQKPIGGSDKLLDSSKAAVLYELDSKTLVYAYQPDEQIDPSGMNKIMTALLALENADMQATVTVTKNNWDYAPAGSVSANLKKGEEIKLIDLMYCMMVGSANDASSLIAEHVGGDQETFVAMMNQRAQALGCTNTNFVNANGIKAEGQYSTARDLAIITEKALENEAFVTMFCAETYNVESTNKSEPRELVTTNYMSSKLKSRDYFDARVIGGKTGALSTTDRSLICIAEHNGLRYLSVVMGAKGRVSEDGLVATAFGNFTETDALLDYGFEKFSVFNLMHQDHAQTQFEVVNGENKVSVCVDQAVRVALPREISAEGVSYRYLQNEQINAPVRKGQQLGMVEAWYNEICVAQYPLIAMHDVGVAGEGMQPLPLTYVPEPKGETVKQFSLWSVVIILFAVSFCCAVILFKRMANSIKRRRLRNAMNVQRR